MTTKSMASLREVITASRHRSCFRHSSTYFSGMTFIGRVSNGAVVLPPDAHLAEGEEVEVRPVATQRRAKTGRELAAIWATKPRLSPEEAESFARDIEEARRNLPPLKAPDWP